jgi:hypothetical protein
MEFGYSQVGRPPVEAVTGSGDPATTLGLFEFSSDAKDFE